MSTAAVHTPDELSIGHPSPARHRRVDERAGTKPIGLALLGLGTVGSAVARLAPQVSLDGRQVRVTGALVRDAARRRPAPDVPRATSLEFVLAGRPDVAIEVLGGIEPARTFTLECFRRGVHVVTANKSLVAAHGDELRDAARSAGVQLRDEATVIAGVPFLATLARRPLASDITGVTGVLNGTSHFILSSIARGETYDGALAEAQRLGLAEPDPGSDVDGIDASEKLSILARLAGRLRLSPAAIPRLPIVGITHLDLEQAARLGGTIKPVAHASWSGSVVHAFVEPAFVPASHPLASIAGLTNGVVLASASGPLFYSGPGAGPDVTARTLLDDVAEVARGERVPDPGGRTVHARVDGPRPEAWLLRVSSPRRLPDGADLADLLASHGVFVRRGTDTSGRDGGDTRWLLTWPADKARLDGAIASAARTAGCSARAFRSLEDADVR